MSSSSSTPAAADTTDADADADDEADATETPKHDNNVIMYADFAVTARVLTGQSVSIRARVSWMLRRVHACVP